MARITVPLVLVALIGATVAKKCTEPLSKCSGAPGYVYVLYSPCCDESKYECGYAPKLGWGKFCIPKTSHHEKSSQYGATAPMFKEKSKCYSNGVRCQGAQGYAYYEWGPCCDSQASCVEAKHLGWGKFCMVNGYTESEYKEPEYKGPDYKDPEYKEKPKCYKDLVRCAGVPGYAYYHFLPCCSGASCVEAKQLGWGKFCVPKSYKPVYKPEAEYKPEPEYKEPEYKDVRKQEYVDPGYKKPSGEKCYTTGARCAGAPGYAYVPWFKCCKEGEQCVEDVHKGWGRFCIDLSAPYKADTHIYEKPSEKHIEPETIGYPNKSTYLPTYPSKCTSEGDECDMHNKCCAGNECAVPWHGGAKVCKKISKPVVPGPDCVPQFDFNNLVNCMKSSECCDANHECRTEPLSVKIGKDIGIYVKGKFCYFKGPVATVPVDTTTTTALDDTTTTTSRIDTTTTTAMDDTSTTTVMDDITTTTSMTLTTTTTTTTTTTPTTKTTTTTPTTTTTAATPTTTTTTTRPTTSTTTFTSTSTVTTTTIENICSRRLSICFALDEGNSTISSGEWYLTRAVLFRMIYDTLLLLEETTPSGLFSVEASIIAFSDEGREIEPPTIVDSSLNSDDFGRFFPSPRGGNSDISKGISSCTDILPDAGDPETPTPAIVLFSTGAQEFQGSALAAAADAKNDGVRIAIVHGQPLLHARPPSPFLASIASPDAYFHPDIAQGGTTPGRSGIDVPNWIVNLVPVCRRR